MRQEPKGLDAEQWRAVLGRLAHELPPNKQRRVTLIGGVAMALGFGGRRTTTDADVILEDDDAGVVLPVARTIADEFDLPSDWMNQKAQKANLVLIPTEAGRPVLEAPSVVFEVPSLERMLAMKLVRWAGDVDVADARTLLEALRKGVFDVEDAWSRIGGFAPVAKGPKAHNNLRILWEMLDETP